MWTYFILLGHRCPESSTCDHSQRGSPEFTWSIVAAGDQRDDRNEKSHKKPDSPHGWEEGKSQGTRILPGTFTAHVHVDGNSILFIFVDIISVFFPICLCHN